MNEVLQPWEGVKHEYYIHINKIMGQRKIFRSQTSSEISCLFCTVVVLSN